MIGYSLALHDVHVSGYFRYMVNPTVQRWVYGGYYSASFTLILQIFSHTAAGCHFNMNKYQKKLLKLINWLSYIVVIILYYGKNAISRADFSYNTRMASLMVFGEGIFVSVHAKNPRLLWSFFSSAEFDENTEKYRDPGPNLFHTPGTKTTESHSFSVSTAKLL